MEDLAREKALEAARQAQADYAAVADEYEAKLAQVTGARRVRFKEAQDAGLTLRQIGEAVGLHNTTVGEILRGD